MYRNNKNTFCFTSTVNTYKINVYKKKFSKLTF